MWSEASLLPDSIRCPFVIVRRSQFDIRTLAFIILRFFYVGLSALQGLAEAPLPRVPPMVVPPMVVPPMAVTPDFAMTAPLLVLAPPWSRPEFRSDLMVSISGNLYK